MPDDNDRVPESPPPQPQFIPVPEFYCDAISMLASAYTVQMNFGLTQQGPTPMIVTLAIIRMSPQHAKLMAITLQRAIHEYEANMRLEIALPPDLLEAQKINLETDW